MYHMREYIVGDVLNTSYRFDLIRNSDENRVFQIGKNGIWFDVPKSLLTENKSISEKIKAVVNAYDNFTKR